MSPYLEGGGLSFPALVDTFVRPDLGDDWSVEAGSVVLSSGSLIGRTPNAINLAVIVAGEFGSDQFVACVIDHADDGIDDGSPVLACRWSSAGGVQSAVLFRADPDGTLLLFEFTLSGNSGTTTPIASVPSFPPWPGATMEMCVSGSSVSCYYNGELALEGSTTLRSGVPGCGIVSTSASVPTSALASVAAGSLSGPIRWRPEVIGTQEISTGVVTTTDDGALVPSAQAKRKEFVASATVRQTVRSSAVFIPPA